MRAWHKKWGKDKIIQSTNQWEGNMYSNSLSTSTLFLIISELSVLHPLRMCLYG